MTKLEAAEQLAKDFRAAWEAKDEDGFWEKFEEACCTLTAYDATPNHWPAWVEELGVDIVDTFLDYAITIKQKDVHFERVVEVIKKHVPIQEVSAREVVSSLKKKFAMNEELSIGSFERELKNLEDKRTAKND